MAAWRTDLVEPAPRLAVDHAGSGPLVKFLHGIGGNRSNWRDQLPAFARHFHAAAWDARGYGASDDYPGPLDFADFSADLIRMLDHFGAERAHLVGLSMGGRIALDFHARHATRVASLVLCDTFAGYDETFTPARRAEFVRLRKQPLLDGKQPADIAPAIAESLIGRDASPEILRRLIDSLSAIHPESYLKTIEATTNYDRHDALAAIAVPTLLVYGAEDRLTPPEIGRRLQRRIPGAGFAMIERAGHLSNIERPVEFNRLVLDFLLANVGDADLNDR